MTTQRPAHIWLCPRAMDTRDCPLGHDWEDGVAYSATLHPLAPLPTYVVTFLPAHRSEPDTIERTDTRDEDVVIDDIVETYGRRGDEVLHIRVRGGDTVYAARGIDR